MHFSTSSFRPFRSAIHAAAILAAYSLIQAEEPVTLAPLVVTTQSCEHPLVIVADAKAPAQPIPAHDGADYLKTVPGFSVIRKGGADGDPVLRGMAGSRLGILIDGAAIMGGCGNRMDPPTAYIFPAAYDRITVLKGPQDVLHGPGNSAGVVLFERDRARLDRPAAALQSAFTVGAFGRRDAAADAHAGTPDAYGRAALTWSEAGDYADGADHDIHARYRRWSANAAVGWTPAAHTLLELSAARSDGEAAYADRMMDGARFDRDNLGLRFLQADLSPLVRSIEVHAFVNYVDHVMDNFSLRGFVPTAMMPDPAVSNPDRRTTGGRASIVLAPGASTGLSLGLDQQADRHSVRSTANETSNPYEFLPRLRDARFLQNGFFGELRQAFGENRRIVAGARLDRWRVHDDRVSVATGMMGGVPNPTAHATRTDDLGSGFVRFEQDITGRGGSALFYAGLGHVARFPDYWEMIARESVASVSAFTVAPEKTTQFDTGCTYRRGAVALNLALFYSDVADFILIETNVAKGMRRATVARNIDARTWGGEAGIAWRIARQWSFDASLASVRGVNDTDDRPLAQLTPLEGRVALTYRGRTWSLGVLQRMVAAQDRVAINQGNIVGQDIGASPGFAVTSLHGAWQFHEHMRVSAGIDNLLDQTYAEHISRAGSMVPGYVQTTRINEPGRTAWVKCDFTY